MKVRATQAGHYGGFYKEPGDVFEVSDEKFPVKDGNGKPLVVDGKVVTRTAFSSTWMEKVADSVPETPLAKPVKRSPLEVLKEKERPTAAANTLADANEVI